MERFRFTLDRALGAICYSGEVISGYTRSCVLRLVGEV